MGADLHRLLRRQLRRHVGDPASLPPEWQAFVAAVNAAYVQADRDRVMLERSLELSSKELVEANTRMRSAVQALEEAQIALESRVAERTRELSVASETLRKSSEDQRKLEAQLRQAQKMEAIGRLAGGVAHDFNNLLTIIFGEVEVLLDMTLDDDVRNSVREVHRAAESAAALTHQLLAFSRQQKLVPTVLEVNDLVRSTTLMLRRLIGEDIELVTDLDLDVGTVRADAGQLQQVLLNLGVNARDAMPTGGRLEVSTSVFVVDDTTILSGGPMRPGAYVAITVTDTGTGMSAETMTRLFEPFFTTKALHRGTGLGLATVYGIVKQSEGSIDVWSEPGRGARFRVLLPTIAPAHDRSSEARVRLGRGAGTVLLVEDQDAVRRIIGGQLRRAGYVVHEANGPGAALELAPTLEPLDLLLTDVVMPQMNGRALALRLLTERPRVKVLYMTGYIDDVGVTRELRDGSHSVLQKPFTRETLLHAVEQALVAPAAP